MKVCKAKQNSGKTIWLGVKAEEGSNDWKVAAITVMIHIIIADKTVSNKIITKCLQTTNGTSVSYFNWKDNAFGNCAYLFTKVASPFHISVFVISMKIIINIIIIYTIIPIFITSASKLLLFSRLA